MGVLVDFAVGVRDGFVASIEAGVRSVNSANAPRHRPNPRIMGNTNLPKLWIKVGRCSS